MFDFEDVKQDIKSKPFCFVYQVKDINNFKLIAETTGKNESREIIKNANNHNGFFIVAKITFHTGKRFGQAGPIAVNLDVYKFVDNKLMNIGRDDIDNNYPEINRIKGIVWFDKYFIEKKGWSRKYIDNIIKKLLNSNIKLMQKMLYKIYFM
jgi:hypothetical protein